MHSVAVRRAWLGAAGELEASSSATSGLRWMQNVWHVNMELLMRASSDAEAPTVFSPQSLT